MPYDPSKSRHLLSIAGAHASNPAAEWIDQLVAQLRDAEAAIAEANTERTKAVTEANTYAAQLEAANATIRRMREEKEQAATAPVAKKSVKTTPAPVAPSVSTETPATKARKPRAPKNPPQQ